VRRDLPVVDPASCGNPGDSRPGAHHQWRTAPIRRKRCMLRPERLNVHLDTLDRERFRKSPAATIWVRCWQASRWRTDRVYENQDQRGGGQESGGARCWCRWRASLVRRVRGAVHRIHAARRAEPLGPEQGAAGGRHDRDPFAEISPLRRFPIRTARPGHDTNLRMAAGTVGFIASVSVRFV